VVISCPSQDDLSAILSGQLPPETLAEIEDHLPTCPSCLDRLNHISDHPELEQWIGKPEARPRPYAFLSPATLPDELGQIDRYRVLSVIGRGGMGVVFRAVDEQLQRPVALKVLRIGRDDPRDIERFRREARAASQVTHDHLVPIWDVVTTHDGRPVLVMPLIVGPTLRNRVPRSDRTTAIDIRQIAAALSALHEAGLVHRDVKPSNILLDQADGRAKLTDFGLIRDDAKRETLTQDGTIVGTPEYISPEQATTPDAVDARSDIYSLGITMYECLTGVVPFRGPILDVLERQRSEEPIAVRKLNSAVPVDLETICAKCLKKRPDERYQSAKELQEDLDRWLAHKPILARSSGQVERSLRWCRRNPWPVALTVVALIGCVVSGFGWWEAGKQTRTAQAATHEAQANLRLSQELSSQALNSINTLISKAQNSLGNTPGTLGLKKQLNEAALEDLRKLSQTVQDLPGLERGTITAHLKLGDTFYILGQTDAAMANWRQAIERAESRLADNADEFDTQLDLARCHDSLSQSLAQLMDFPAAISHNEQARQILEQLSTRSTPDAKTLGQLALAHGNRGRIALWQQQPEVGLVAHNKSADLWKQALQLTPADDHAHAELSATTGRIGNIYLVNRHDYERAERVFREQYDLAKSQVQKQPESRIWPANLRRISLDLATAQQRLGRWQESVALVKSVLIPLSKLSTEDPENTLLQREYAAAFAKLGDAHMMGKQFREAQDSYARSWNIIQAISAKSGGLSQYSSDLFSLTHALSVITFRLNQYEDSARWLERHGEITLELYGKLMTAPEREFSKATNRVLALSIRQVPELSQDPNLLLKLTTATQKPTYYFVVWKHICGGDLPTAERLLKTASVGFSSDPAWKHIEAMWHGAMAEQSLNPVEREDHIVLGSRALIASHKANSYILSTMYLHPELRLISQNSDYKLSLQNMLVPSTK
jgi:serine/threonine protein kinase